MHPRLLQVIPFLALCVAGLAGAAEPRGEPVAPPAPAAEERAATAPRPPDEGFEPEITITTKGTEIHEEYRYNGQVYLVRVTPARGPSYYLIYDERGNVRRSDLEPDIIVPQWIIKRF